MISRAIEYRHIAGRPFHHPHSTGLTAYKAPSAYPVTKAQARPGGLAAIGPRLDLGETVSVASGATHIADAAKTLSDYNKALKSPKCGR
ncbi:hypothetical protein GCM10022409_35710 [Hymenobacter glaciei]|uniref:Uncharacterized protein n=1 Tax=Hymenobacter glaciei TaxID=877209 RepID=A0ABP7UM12_9BACT